MPIISIDWLAVSDKYSGDTVLVAITDRQLAFINSLSAQLSWRKTWRVNGYDFSDYDALSAEVDDLLANLNMPVYLTDLLTALADIKAAINAIEAVQDYCCQETDPTGGLQYVAPFIEGETNGVPQTLVDAGIATDADDWTSFEQYQCAIANLFVDNLKSKLDDMDTLFGYGGALIAGIGALATLLTVFSGGSALLLTGMIVGTAGAAALFDKLQELGQLGLPDSETIEGIRQELVCAWTSDENDGFDDRWGAWVQALHDNLNDAGATFAEGLSMKSTMRPLYAAQQGDRNLAQELVDLGFDVDSYDCSDCDNPYAEPGNLLTDGGFESASLDYGWQKSPDASVSWPTDAYLGDYCFRLGGGSGYPSRYAYQEFLIPTTGVVRLGGYAKYVGSTYGTEVYLERWNGSSWTNLANMDPTGNTSWNYKETANVAVTEGDVMRVRIANGSYHYLDQLKVYYP